ncbi:MAG TPA: class II aldolase/adducin family protein [Burkholderiaceae bacterium]|nr:class II aldolase/adducin family protein [Burkholderiaceae bacterium]
MSSPSSASVELIEALVDANHILYHQGIVDAFGHVSVRHDRDPSRFLLARNMAPGRVQAPDIVEYAVDSGEALQADAPRGYLERYIHSEIYKARPDVMAVVHNHSPAVLPFCIARGARLRPVCHMAGFLGGSAMRDGPALFEIREHAGTASNLLVSSRELGAALAHTLGASRVVLMRGHGCTVVGESLAVAVFRAVYTEVNAKLVLQTLPLGELNALTPEEADATRITNEGQAARPWDLWREQARAQRGLAP